MVFTGSRLRVARERRGLTRRALAEQVELSERILQEHEAGRTRPTDEHVKAFATALRFPLSFFQQADLEMPSPDIASFRSLKSMTAAQRDMALAAGALCMELSRWVDRRFTRPPSELPNLHGCAPEAAAAALRDAWGLQQRPIKNMIHLLEFKGVRVFSLVQDARELDAFSLWQEDTPFVFLNTKKSGERGRFDAAHELGHLVLHRDRAPAGRDLEKEADRFASAFLMPRESVIQNAPRLPNRQNLTVLKRLWGVSVMALLVRLHGLQQVTDWQYRRLCIDLSDCRTVEPEPISRETSQVLGKVFGALESEGIQKKDVARAIHLHLSDLEELVFGLAALPSGPPEDSFEGTPRRAQLRLVRD